MNIAKAFVDYMVLQNYGVFGDNIFIGGAPVDSPDVCWWVVLSGGNNETKASTGEIIGVHRLNVYYRSMDVEDVYNTLQDLFMNLMDCINLGGYEVLDINVQTYPTDSDLDLEDRVIGVMEVNIRAYHRGN